MIIAYSGNDNSKNNVEMLREQPKTDFMTDDTWTFEVGGPSKSGELIRGLPGAYIAADEIEEGSGNRIPLWLFGFLY